MLHDTVIRTGQLVVSAVFLNGFSGFDRELPLSGGHDVQIEELSFLLSRHAGDDGVILRHVLFHRGDARSVRFPRARNVPFIDSVQAVILLADVQEKPVGELCLVHIADYDVQVGVLGMVQVVHLAALEKAERLPKIRNVAGLGVYDLRFRIDLLQKLRERLGGLLRLGKLALHEGCQLVIRQFRVSFQAVELFIAYHFLIVQHRPERKHSAADILRDRIGVRLFAVQDTLYEHAVLDAVVLDAGAREYMIDIIGLVIVQRSFQINRIAGIHTLPELRIVQEELVSPQRALLRRRKLFVQLAAVPLAGLIELQKLFFSGFGSRSLLLLILAARHLDKDLRRRAAADMGDLIGDLQRLPDAAAHGRRDVHFVQPRSKAVAAEAGAPPFLCRGRKIGVLRIVEQLHEIKIRISQKIQNVLRFALLIRAGVKLCQKLLGKPAPVGIFQTTDFTYIVLVQRGKILFQPTAQHTFVVAVHQRSLYDFFDRLFAEYGDERRKIVIRSQSGFHRVVNAADLVGFCGIAVHDKIVQNAFFRHAAIVFFEKIVDQLLLDSDRKFPVVDAQRVQLVEKHKFAVQQRIFRQHRRAGVGAFSDQVFQKGRRARVEIHNIFEIPRVYLFSGPHRPMVFHRSDVIRYAEGEHRFDLFADGDPVFLLLQQERQIRRCVVQNFPQLLPVELIRDDAVFAAGQPRKKRLLFDLRILRCERMLRRRFGKHRLEKSAEILLLAGLIPALRTVAAVGGIVIRELRVFIEYAPVFVRRRFSHIVLQRAEVGMVFLILTDLCIAEILLSAAHFRQPCRIKHFFCRKQQLYPLAQRRRERVKHGVQIVAQRDARRFGIFEGLIVIKRSQLDFGPRKQIGQGLNIRAALLRLHRLPQSGAQRRLLLGYAHIAVGKDREVLRLQSQLHIHFRREILCQLLHRGVHCRAFVAVLRCFIKEMPAVLDDMVKSQKHKSRIMGLRRMHQLAAQMIYRRIPAQIIPVGEMGIIEERIFSGSGRLIVRKERTFMQPAEKERIGFPDFRGKQFFQIQKTLFPPLQPAAGDARRAPVRRRFCLFKQSRAPHGVSLEAQNVVFRIAHRPADGIGAYIKADIIRRVSPDCLFLFHFAFSSIDKFQKYAKYISDPDYHLGLHYKFK